MKQRFNFGKEYLIYVFTGFFPELVTLVFRKRTRKTKELPVNSKVNIFGEIITTRDKFSYPK